MSEYDNIAHVVHEADNVATALGNLANGKVFLLGVVRKDEAITAVGSIKKDFKIALREIMPDEPIIKYGIPIAKATKKISAGECVHLHNAMSYSDNREIDPSSAELKEIRYTL